MNLSPCRSYAVDRWRSNLYPASCLLLGSPTVVVRSSGEGRGLGAFVTRTVPAFSLIISDAPLILMRPNDDLPELYKQFISLPDEDKETYLRLTNQESPSRNALLKDKLLQRGFGLEGLERMAQVAGIMMTNAFNVDLRDGQGASHRALFPALARVNHSCAPNAHACYYPPSRDRPQGQMMIHALRTLQPGEEVLISYFKIILPRSERQEKAKKWGFECDCPVCDESSSEHQHFERQRKDIRDFEAEVASPMSRLMSVRSLKEMLDKSRHLIIMAERHSELYPTILIILDMVGILYDRALIEKDPDEGLGLDMISNHEKSVMWEARITGLNSPATKNRLAQLVRLAIKRGSKARPRIVVDEGGSYAIEWSKA